MPWTPTHVEKISDYPVRLLRIEGGRAIFDDIYEARRGMSSSVSEAMFKKSFKEIKETKPRKPRKRKITSDYKLNL